MAEGLRKIWDRGGVAVGIGCMMPGSFAAELLGHLGFDFLMIDCQHGLIGYDSMFHMLQAASAAGTTAVVRVQSHQPGPIGAALDAGAAGVIIPAVNSAEEARAIVAACKYAPEGTRSLGPVRSEMYVRGSYDEVNRNVLCLPMIETVEGVEAAAQICSVPGVDGVMLGPADLALSMGLTPGSDSPALAAALAEVVAAARANNLVAMIGSGPDQVSARVEAGYRMILLGADYLYLKAAAGGALSAARGGLAAGAPA